MLTIVLDFSVGSPDRGLKLALVLLTGTALGFLPAPLTIPLLTALIGLAGVGRVVLVVRRGR